MIRMVVRVTVDVAMTMVVGMGVGWHGAMIRECELLKL
jgi:hypothetical protein